MGPSFLGACVLLGGPGLYTNTVWSLSSTGPLPMLWETSAGPKCRHSGQPPHWGDMHSLG